MENYRKEKFIMANSEQYAGGENFDLRHILVRGRELGLRERMEFFQDFLRSLGTDREALTLRQIATAADRQVDVLDPHDGTKHMMLMFGSNNYLGLAHHPCVRARVEEAIRRYGTGLGGPPLLNGYTPLHRSLEERLAALKGTEDALLFSSGYGANAGVVSGLLNRKDIVLYDAYSHASFCDGLKLAGVQSLRFPHNDVGKLGSLLAENRGGTHDVFVGVEGVYSMDGDLAPLDAIVPLCKAHGALLILDDAHGTGVIGRTGRGTAEHFGVHGEIDATVGTFSKTLAVTGGFIAASKPVIDYLRYFARSYMFSASLPPMVIAAVHAGLDVMEREPELLERLRENTRYAVQGFRSLGFDVKGDSPIIALRVPIGMNIRHAGQEFHRRGIFVNSIEYPAVPVSQQRFRISMMAAHTRSDIDALLTAVKEVWEAFAARDLATVPEEMALAS
ncbi:aminotransferase class I/II-fold pyridoxal phosphate-dependent enzyme [bacterium]|nr:MAG: aminotransferase class I/II-fold pyridoxal phosphate-dependent enzyme [bacterium]